MATADYETETPTRTHRGEIAEPLDAVSLDAVGTAVAEPLETDADPLATDVAPVPTSPKRGGPAGRQVAAWARLSGFGLDRGRACRRLAAPFFFTWKALAVSAFLAWLTGSIGVCMGYHRQLTHGSFSTYRPIRLLFAFIGGLVGRGLGPDVGGQSSQAPHVQRQGGRSAFAARRQMVEPHAVVHAGAGPQASSKN